MSPQNTLAHLRQKVNNVDLQIVQLLDERARITQEIANLKDQLGMPLTDSAQEARIISQLMQRSKVRVVQHYITEIYRVIFTLSKSQRTTRRKPSS
jgi:3-deoxy-7-phosphoheptulonate synthase/chorismate mutase